MHLEANLLLLREESAGYRLSGTVRAEGHQGGRGQCEDEIWHQERVPHQQIVDMMYRRFLINCRLSLSCALHITTPCHSWSQVDAITTPSRLGESGGNLRPLMVQGLSQTFWGINGHLHHQQFHARCHFSRGRHSSCAQHSKTCAVIRM